MKIGNGRIGIHPSVLQRYVEGSSLSHFDFTKEELLERVMQAVEVEEPKRGKFDGSIILPIKPDDVYCRPGREAHLLSFSKPLAARAEVVLLTRETIKKHGLVHPGFEQFEAEVVAVHGWPSGSA